MVSNRLQPLCRGLVQDPSSSIGLCPFGDACAPGVLNLRSLQLDPSIIQHLQQFAEKSKR